MSHPQPLSPLDRKISFTGVLLLVAIVLTFAVVLLPIFDISLPGSAAYMPLIAWAVWGASVLARLWLRF